MSSTRKGYQKIKIQKWHRCIVVLSVIIIVVCSALFVFFVKRQNLRNESIHREKMTYYVSGAVNRAMLLGTNDFHKTKTVIKKDIRLMFMDARVDKKYCNVSLDGELVALMPDGNSVAAEYQNCLVSSFKKVYKRGIADRMYRLIDKVPVVNWLIGLYLGDIYDTVLCLSGEMMDNEEMKVSIYDAIENPCKYLYFPQDGGQDDKFNYRGNLARFDLEAWRGLFCDQNEIVSFDINVNILYVNNIDKDNYKEVVMVVTNNGGF